MPLEGQRPIFKEIIRNIEIHPMKLKIELYAPAANSGVGQQGPEKQKATGTGGLCVSLKKSEATVIPIDSTRRVGSSNVGNGTRDSYARAIWRLRREIVRSKEEEARGSQSRRLRPISPQHAVPPKTKKAGLAEVCFFSFTLVPGTGLEPARLRTRS